MLSHIGYANTDRGLRMPRRMLVFLMTTQRPRPVYAGVMLALLIRTMLTKKYGAYKGCCTASWIALVFGGDVSSIKSARARLIQDGWFARLDTPQRVRQRYGEWVVLVIEQPVGNIDETEPPAPPKSDETEPPLQNQSLSNEIETNQSLHPGASQIGGRHADLALRLGLHYTALSAMLNGRRTTQYEGYKGCVKAKWIANVFGNEPTWTNITLEDLHDDARSETLHQAAIELGHLKNTQPDRINFFAAITHALRVAKRNACGLLRTIVEKGLWHFITQADESHAIRRLQRSTKAQGTQATQRMHGHPFLTTSPGGTRSVEAPPIELSEDAVIVQTLTADLRHAGVTGDVLWTVRRHGYLRDWNKERWECAEQELVQARLQYARQRCQAIRMTGIQEVIEGDSPEVCLDESYSTSVHM